MTEGVTHALRTNRPRFTPSMNAGALSRLQVDALTLGECGGGADVGLRLVGSDR